MKYSVVWPSCVTSSTSWHLSAFLSLHFAQTIVPDSVVSSAETAATAASPITSASTTATLLRAFMRSSCVPAEEGAAGVPVRSVIDRAASSERPRRAVRPVHERLGLRVAGNRLGPLVPRHPSPETERDIAEVAGDHRRMADLDVGSRPLACVHALEEVADVQLVIVPSRPAPGLARGAVPSAAVLRLGLGEHFPAAPIDHEHAVVAVEGHAVIAHVRALADRGRML